MCGIFSILNNTFEKSKYTQAFSLGNKRGPENSVIECGNIYNNIILGFSRLAINGFNNIESEQPFLIDNCSLICNGEIYNFSKLYQLLNVSPKSKSDCEVIIHMYKKYGIKQTLNLLDGVFAFVLIDYTKKIIYVARDPYGVRPLFYSIHNNVFIFASLLKQITPMSDFCKQFPPGYCFRYDIVDNKSVYNNMYQYSSTAIFTNKIINTEEKAIKLIRDSFINAIRKRVHNTERDIACLLSGGLDSSLVASIVSFYYKKKFPNKKLHTWSIGFKGSEDLKHAKLVAKHIDSIHHSIVVDEQEFINAIEHVIYTIESYDTTSVRASVGNYLISKYIKSYEKTVDAKVVFNGDGADELMGGYLYFHYIKDPIIFDKECKRLLNNIHFFDVLRSDRSISENGLEARTPFLDRNFVQNYLSIPSELRCHTKNGFCEKYLIRRAFDDGTLPESVLWRTKEAFSDGVSSQSNSWHNIIKDHAIKKFLDDDNLPNDENSVLKILGSKYTFNKPTTLEQLYYRLIFEKHFPNSERVIPYFWMPRYVKATDASARSLKIYKKLIKTKEQ